MQQDTPNYEAVEDTLRWTAQGYVIGAGGSIRPMPWRQILDCLSVLGRDELLRIDPTIAGGTGRGIAVGRIAAGGESGAPFSGSRETLTVDTREGPRAESRFAQRIEMAVRSGKSATCVRTASGMSATLAAAPEPARSNGDCAPPPRVRPPASHKRIRIRRNRYATYMLVAS